MNTSAFSCFEKKYYGALWDEIKNQCILVNQCKTEIYEKQIGVPWFGDIQYTWKNFKKTCPYIFWKRFPANLTKEDRLPEIATELHYLLPNTDLVKTFLPVLLSSYVTKRKSNFWESLNDEDLDIDQIECKKDLWSTPPLRDTFPKLTADNVSLTCLDRGLSVYSKIIQFFVFVEATSHICNVSLSFFGFDAMTGYLRLLGADARHYINESGKTMENQLLCISSEINQEILQYIEYTIDTVQNMNVPKNGKPWQLPFELLTFMYNLKCELTPNASVSLDENDPLEKAHQYDVMREAYLNGDRTSIFDIMCNPNG